jgi:hypothetical protein
MNPGNRWRSACWIMAALSFQQLLAAAPAGAQLFVGLTQAGGTGSTPTHAALLLTDGTNLLTAPTLTGAGFAFGLARNPLTGDLITVAAQADNSLVLARVDFQAGTIVPYGSPLGAGIRSIAFDSKGNLFGFALCDPVYSNELFQIDPVSGDITGIQGSLDSGRVAPCGSGLTAGAVIAIDPSDDTLYFSALDASGNMFIDRISPLMVPTEVNGIPPLFLPMVPLAATVAHGQLWISTGATVLGPGFGFAMMNLSNGVIFETSGAAFTALSIGSNPPVFGIVAATPSCVPSGTAACLYNRFKVSATYDATPDNGSGPATVLLESAQTVKFSFFDVGNVELIVKILNACVPPFNKWWVSAGGLTNVGVQVRVADTSTGAVKTYASTKGQLFQTLFDTAAFNCP